MGRAAGWTAMLALALVAGSATGQAPAPATSGAPPPLAAGEGRIVFYRETWHALAVQPQVTMNGTVVGKAMPNEYFVVDRKPGTYEIATVEEPERKFTLALAAGETRYASLEFTVTWFLVAHINPMLVDNATGEKGIIGLRYASY